MKNIKFNHFFNAIIALALTSSVLLQSCGREEEEEGELITTVSLSINNSGGTPTTYTWKDLDGPGGNAPTLPDTIKLGVITPGGNPYSATLEFFNEQNGSKEDITLEVKNEGHDHFVCYEIASLSLPPTGLNITPTDKDKNNLPIGLKTEWTCSGADFGRIVVRLKHQPGIKTGSCEPGDTDVEVTFPYFIK